MDVKESLPSARTIISCTVTGVKCTLSKKDTALQVNA